MTPLEILNEAKLFQREVGPKAELFPAINMSGWGECPLRASLYANGMMKELTFSVDANGWVELFARLRAKWSEFQDEHRARSIRKMSLEIIRLTADLGACTDGALRQAGFEQGEIDAYGSEACADADAIAANGPFSIQARRGANAA